jgi:glucose-6-phosphate isomerase
MWRGVKEKGDLRYDITLIPPNVLGREFVKTKGHFHLGDFGELYQVLEGKGIFLLQKGKSKVKDVYFVKAKKGEFVKIPPGYAHLTINPQDRPLKIGNWILKNVKSDYLPLEKKRGACYYLTVYGWRKNKNYKKIPPLKRKKALKKFPKNLKFLYGN